MPVRRVAGGYKWGDKGKVYPTREEALKQGKTIKASKEERRNAKKT